MCDELLAVFQPCELCPTVGGLLKQTVNGRLLERERGRTIPVISFSFHSHSALVPIPRWVHVVCSLYTPGIEYVEPEQLSGVNLDQLAASKWGTKVSEMWVESVGINSNCVVAV